MRRITAVGAVLSMAMDVAVALAQARPDFSGTWKLDPGRSRIVETAGLTGLSAVGAPATLHVTQPANGTLVVESQINEGHARFYRPGHGISTPVTVGQTGSIRMTSRWEGRALVSEGTRDTAASAGASRVKEVLSLSGDGRTLTVEVTTTAGGEKSASTMVYTRAETLGPCQSWPTPCKTPAR